MNDFRQMAGEVLGVPTAQVPNQMVYRCRNEDLARAVTLRNAVHLLVLYINGFDIRKNDPPWHANFNGCRECMIDELTREGYLNPTIN